MWNCSKCGEENEETFDSCWNCQTNRYSSATVVEPDDIEEPAGGFESPNASAVLNRQYIGFALTFLGLVLIIVGVVHLTTMQSKLMRAIGGEDDTAIALFIFGAPSLLVGTFLAFVLPSPKPPVMPPQSDNSTEQRLRKLQSLKNQGIVTAEEYERKRKQILRDL